MSGRVNAWIAISDVGAQALKDRFEWDSETPYTGPVTEEAWAIMRKLLSYNRMGRWKTPQIGGKTWHLFSVYLDSPAQAQAAFTYLENQYPANFELVGAWDWGTGAQLVPPHARLTDFMHDGVAADLVVEQGQAMRDFT